MEDNKPEKVKPPKKTVNGKRNRRAGHQYERDLANKHKELGFVNAATSRKMSRVLDDSKIDIYGLPWNIQAKNVASKINYEKLFLEVSEAIKKLVPFRSEYPTIIAHKKDGKSLMIMTEEDYFKLIKLLLSNSIEELNQSRQM